MRRSSSPLFIAAALVAVLAACSLPTEGPGTIIGEYSLEGRDGMALPLEMMSGDTLISAPLTMRADSTFTSLPTYRNGTRQYTNTISGSWSVSGTMLSYRSGIGEIATGTFRRGWVTFVQAGTLRFVRR